MTGLFTVLRQRVDRNAKRAVEVYTNELADFRAAAAKPTVRAGMLDFAVLLRRREAELAADGAPFEATDLASLTAFGAERGAQGVSLADQRGVLLLHSMLTLREIQEVAAPNQLDHLMAMLAWLPTNGLAAQQAYTRGYLAGQKKCLPVVNRFAELAKALLEDSVLAADLAESLELRLAQRHLVLVMRVLGMPFAAGDGRRDQVVDLLLRRERVPMAWYEPDELVAVLPADDPNGGTNGGTNGGEQLEHRALTLAREFAELVDRPCSTGAAQGPTGALGETLTLARRVNRVSPPETVPSHIPTLRDVFVELGVTELPQVDEWLRDLARRLAAGPDLVRTLDAFYRHDMNRLNTAGELRIHPRTLDYRLHRVRELVGLEPASTRGVRTLSAAVARLRAG
ncbi:PucR family transcriptional regulator [Actinophytocola xanthii]|uniref:PucR C-terminal helix-turn-helix domain-containing protein n=1 Tax=Actinophytocola xanthii TaxID=1912961 RepID=A0A1Q8CM80_9PSEU|nr:helix-turn-helix domain-containing protein [Actinophytocola xanthii]OLF15467.1 hypothetical protein BU204_21280 [Actinophytocola xanthii]